MLSFLLNDGACFGWQVGLSKPEINKPSYYDSKKDVSAKYNRTVVKVSASGEAAYFD